MNLIGSYEIGINGLGYSDMMIIMVIYALQK